MLIVGDSLISEDVKDIHFACDLKACKGICCVEGDAGAPLDEEEIGVLEDSMEEVYPYMRHEGAEVIRKTGVFDYDSDGEMVTPLINGNECAFVVFDKEQIAFCAIEKAFEDGKIKFQKPISCHLYPVRISKYSRYEAVNYHRWEICNAALIRGEKKEIPLFQFLETPLKRKYGNRWYEELKIEIEKDL